jgi:hypothetical protein
LNDSGGNDNATALQEERSAESAASFRPHEASFGKEETSGDEENDGSQRFEPAIGMSDGQPGRSESQKYRIPLGRS